MKALAAACLFALTLACVPPTADLCRRGVELECTRQFECQPDSVKNSEGFKGGYGASVDECKFKIEAQAACGSLVSDDQLCTGVSAGKKFVLAKAIECSDATKALSCADYLDPSKTPAACSQRCQ